MDKLDEMLSGGDLRSIGKANLIVAAVRSQEDFDILMEKLYHTDRRFVMRAADAIEKITTNNPWFLANHKEAVLKLCYSASYPELKWHLALLIARLPLNQAEKDLIWELLTTWATDRKESRIVRVNAIQSLADLATGARSRIDELSRIFSFVEEERVPSLNARIRKIRKRIVLSAARQ